MIWWGAYARFVWAADGNRQIWIRRAKCKPCARGHALLPYFLLLLRFYPVQLIGSALMKAHQGQGMRAVARRLRVPHTTCRDWWRRYRARAPTVAAQFAAVAVELGGDAPTLSADPASAGLEALAVAFSHAKGRFGAGPFGLWEFFSAVTGGEAMSTTTTPPYAGRSGGYWMTPVVQQPTER